MRPARLASGHDLLRRGSGKPPLPYSTRKSRNRLASAHPASAGTGVHAGCSSRVQTGRMLWFIRKKFVGSYFFLISTNFA